MDKHLRFVRIDFVIGTWSLITAILNGSANTGTFKAAIFIVPSIAIVHLNRCFRRLHNNGWMETQWKTNLLENDYLATLLWVNRIVWHRADHPMHTAWQRIGGGGKPTRGWKWPRRSEFRGKWKVNGKRGDDQLREFWEEEYLKLIEIM